MVTGMATAKAYTAALAASPDSTKNYGCEYTLCSDAMYISVDIWATGPLSFGERCVVVEKISSIPYSVFILVAELVFAPPCSPASKLTLTVTRKVSLHTSSQSVLDRGSQSVFHRGIILRSWF